ncbi:glutaminyl-peptide cyclotransferase [Salinisphaera sp. Q1T1-3]|nr:glutaminyl-peptide cyclotransferase [Salinisphaera sp. Q1T1-3]
MLSLGANAALAAPTADVVARYPHDPDAFTQGLLIWHGALYESTGQYGVSTLRRVDLHSGRVRAQHVLSGLYFGEGLARYDQRLYQLTWKAGMVFLYDARTLAPAGHLSYQGEGWGLARCGDTLAMSNGSATLRFRDPETFKVRRQITVTDDDRPLARLNELEVIHGLIWANVWQTDRIVVIDPSTGRVVGGLDAGALSAEQPAGADVLNGIAYDTAGHRIYLTGKYWSTLYALGNDPDPAQSVPASHRCPAR